MSQRTTMTSGTAISGEGADGAPAELDPLGGNVGLSSPYQVFYQEPPPALPTLQPMDDTSPTYVNGQRVTATLDGMPIGLGQSMSMLQNGSAVPGSIAQFNNTVFGLGIGGSYVETPGSNSGGGNACSNGVCPSGAVTVNAPQSTFIFVSSFSTVSWNPRQQTQQGNQTLTTNATISRNIVPRTLSEEDCNFLLNHLFGDTFSKVATTRASEIERTSAD